LIVPEVWILGVSIQLRKARLRPVEVKDASSAASATA
jgi:hypothetical protein